METPNDRVYEARIAALELALERANERWRQLAVENAQLRTSMVRRDLVLRMAEEEVGHRIR
jgi:hypothetical protein